jgi:hypothetical protein
MGLKYVREGLRAFAQDLTLPYICSNFFGRLPLLYFLAMRSGQTTKSDMRIGRPGMAPILSGASLSKAKKQELSGFSVFVDVHTQTSDDTKEMGARDTRPTVTTSQDQNFGKAEFRRSRIITPIKLSHSAIRVAMGDGSGTARNADTALKNLTRTATDEALGVHSSAIATRSWFGGVINPTDSVDYTFNQNEYPWKRYLGVLACMNTDNVYARVNRSNISSTAAWRGKRVTTSFAPDIFEIIDEMNIGQSCADSGVGDGGITLGLCTKTQFRKYKRQARKEGQKYWAEGVPEMAQLGFKREVIQVDNTYVTYDPLCPAGYFAGFNMGTWTYAADSTDNFNVTDFESMCDNGQSGGEEADQAFVITEASLINSAPYANCLMTNINEN